MKKLLLYFVLLIFASAHISNIINAVTCVCDCNLWQNDPAITVDSGGIGPNAVAYSPNGQFAAVVNSIGTANVTSYTIDSISGAFTFAGTNTAGISEPESVVFSPDSLYAAVANNGNDTVQVYSVDPTTGIFTLQNTYSTGSGPSSVAYSPDGKLAAVTNADSTGPGNLSVYSVSGAIFTPVPSVITGDNPQSVVFTQIGGVTYAAVANSVDIGLGSVSVYSVNTTTGAFTEVFGSPFAAGLGPASVAYSPNGKFAAVTNEGDNSITVYSVEQVGLTPGAFTQIGLITTNVSAPVWIAFAQIGGVTYAVIANSGNNNVLVYSVDQTTGVFTAVSGSPFSSGVSSPVSVAFSANNRFIATANAGGNNITFLNFISLSINCS